MVKKAIIEIDVQDAAWQKFQDSFAKYQQTLAHGGSAWDKVRSSFGKHQKQFAQQKGNWGSIGKAATAAINPFIKMAAAASVLNTRLKQAPNHLTRLKILGQASVGMFDKIGKSTLGIARNIGRATLGLMRWAGIGALFSGLVGGGSLFGLDRLATSASNQRRQSQGYGVTPGALQSARSNFSNFVDVDSSLEGIANTRSDLSKQWIFSSMGIDPSKGSNVDLLGSSLKAAKHKFEEFGSTQQGADANGLSQIYDMDTLRRLHAMTDQEIDDAVKKQKVDEKTLGINDSVLKSWQDLQKQLMSAGQWIEKTLIVRLSSLSGPLAKLSDAVAQAFDTFLSSPKIGEWIDKLSVGIEEFAKYLTSDAFTDDIHRFVNFLGDAADAIQKFVKFVQHPIDTLFGPSGGTTTGASTPERHWYGSFGRTGAASGDTVSARNHNPGNLRSWGGAPVVDGFAKFNSDDEGLRAMQSQLALYGSGQSQAAGHRKLDTVRSILQTYAPSSENDTKAYISDLTKRTGFGADEHLDMGSKEVLARLMAGMTKHENAGSDFSESRILSAIGGASKASSGNPQYLTPVIIEISNATGGSAVVTANALAR